MMTKETIQNTTSKIVFSPSFLCRIPLTFYFAELCRGREMERRRTEREREMESDNRDRQKEKEELEELKTKIFSEGHSDPTATLKQVRKFMVKVS